MNYREDAIKNLKHIKIELDSTNVGNLRAFIDFWYCYTFDFVSSGGRPNWGDLWGRGVVSKSVEMLAGATELVGEEKATQIRKVMSNKIQGINTVTRDHAVPINVITKKLKALVNPSIEDIEAILIKYATCVTITRMEDKMLNAEGLNRVMPPEFYDPEHELFENIYARYIVAGIDIVHDLTKDTHYMNYARK